MYPSDNYYVYANGVENECFNDPTKCYYQEANPTGNNGMYNHPETGWIYNSNILDGQSNNLYVWFLSPYSGNICSGCVFGSYGSLNYDGGEYIVQHGVRPTVYLKSSIQITGGEGTEQNPYTLSNP